MGEELPSTVVVLAAVLCIVGGGIALGGVIDDTGQVAGNPAGDPIVRPTVSQSEYSTLYEETIDSVVTIRVTGTQGSSQGTGFVYDTNGYIITNEHVVGTAETVGVRFADDSWRQGRVVGTDVYTDLAVIRVTELPAGVDPLPIASNDPEPGQRVAALGSPFGLEASISSGIVSGVNRTMDTDGGFSIPATVQTDAPINPGNSGGPLVSMNGTVVGVNRAKSGDNIGFAISPQLVTRVVPELIDSGSYDHSYMGVQTIPVTPAVAEANEIDRPRGVLVVGTVDGGPSAGVFEPAQSRTTVRGRLISTDGDIILRVEGMRIDTQQDLSRVLMLHTEPGDTVSVTVLRDGEQQTVEVTLGTRPTPRR